MGILDRIGGRERINQNTSFRITQEGREQIIRTFGVDAKSRVLQALETIGTGNVRDIAQAGTLSRGQVERALMPLVRGGMVQPISSVAMDDMGD